MRKKEPISHFLNKLNKKLILLTFAIGGVSCKSIGDHESSVARVKEVDSDQLLIVAKRIPVYLSAMPFSYSNDGCYARGFLMSADLAVSDVPIEVLNQSRVIKDQRLETAQGVRWAYHTAPQFYYQGTAYVIDPAHQIYPMTRAKWLELNNVKGIPAFVKVSARNRTGNDYYTASSSQFDLEKDMNDFVKGTFSSKTLISSGETLGKYIDKESLSAEEKLRKKKNLITLIQDILGGLWTKGRLDTQGASLQGEKDAVAKALLP